MDRSKNTAPVDFLTRDVEAYLGKLMARFRSTGPRELPVSLSPQETADAAWEILTGRAFCYLGRSRSARYREKAVASLLRNTEAREPLTFYYDIGPGYHASLFPGEAPLRFDVGLSELFILGQVAAFASAIGEIYAHGTRFHLVVDNLCALATNDIPVTSTESYCAMLRKLIAETDMHRIVELTVESELFSETEYRAEVDRVVVEPIPGRPTDADMENVFRFLGRTCSEGEACDRMMAYKRAGEGTENLLAGVVNGVRMTQRASATTLGFRPFPGGDSRTQCGEVAVAPNAKGNVRAILLTSRNVDDYRRTPVSLPDLLPPSVPEITWAEPIDD